MMHFWFNYIPFVSNNVLPTPEITAKKKIFPRISLQSILFFYKVVSKSYCKKVHLKIFWIVRHCMYCTRYGMYCSLCFFLLKPFLVDVLFFILKMTLKGLHKFSIILYFLLEPKHFTGMSSYLKPVLAFWEFRMHIFSMII